MSCTSCAALLFTLLAGCAATETEARGHAPATAEFALSAGQGRFARAVEAGLAAEDIRIVRRESAEYVLRARYDLERTTSKVESGSGSRLGGGITVDHQTGYEAIHLWLDGPDANELELDREPDVFETECAAVLTLTVIRRRTGKTVWTGWARDWGKASRTGTTTTGWIERAVRKLVRKMRN